MNELERIAREASAIAEPYVLATVVRVSGSSYRRPGARMLVAGDRWLSGCVSGGCLEGDVMLRGAHRCQAGPVVVTYDSTEDSAEPWLGCNGVVDVLLELVPAGGGHDALAFGRACLAAERAGTLITVIASAVAGAEVGTRIALGPGCELVRPVRAAEVRAALVAAAGAPGVIAAGGVTALVERVAPSPQLFVLGSGHDAAPLVALATTIGFRVTVADLAIREPSRFPAAARRVSHGGRWAEVGALLAAAAEAHVVILHHQVSADRAALGVALASPARYIGVLGPARRTRDLLADLGRAGAASDPRLHAPIGLDVGAETPEQIALAIVAEVQAASRQAHGAPLRARARALHADVATIVLAAGGSRRLGQAKQLVEIAGEPLLRRVTRACVALGAGPVGVVLGARADEVAPVVGDLSVSIVRNAAWQEGIASSICAGVRWAESTHAAALLIVLADQPLLALTHLAALRAAWLAGSALAASRYAGTLAVPALFDRACWPQLLALTGDQGAARLLRGAGDAVTAIDWPAGEVDIDTAADVAAAQAQAKI